MRVAGFERYEVTPQGEVINTGTGRVLKRDYNRTGYPRVTLSQDGAGKRVFVHRLVATHYLPNPYGLPEVNHLNGVKDDGRACNLEWVSSSANKQHAKETGLSGDKTGRTYISKETVHTICNLLVSGLDYNSISSSLGVSYNTICLIKTGRSWKKISSQYQI